MYHYVTPSSSSCARSVPDIGDHGPPFLSVANSPDQLVVGGFFLCYVQVQTVCVIYVLSSSAFRSTYFTTR